MLLISLRMEVNSVFSAVDCAVVSPPFEASVAMVTAWLRMVVTWESAPSAVCNRPTPFEAFWLDWVRAAMLAPKPLAIDRPAGSSAPELIFNPVDSCWRVLCRLVCVLETAFSATGEEMFLMTLMLICTAPYIDFRLHRTRPENVEVQNRYLEQVVVGTGNLSACRIRDSSHPCENVCPLHCSRQH